MLQLKSMSDIREAKDGRKFYVLGAVDAEDPFATRITKRTVFQQFTAKSAPDKQMNDINPVWVGGEPSIVKNLIATGKAVKGNVVTLEVPEYTVGDRTATTYSTIVFATENYRTVFKNAGHPLEDNAIAEVVEANAPEVTEEAPLV